MASEAKAVLNAVLVRELRTSTTDETLYFFFCNKRRSNGGQVLEIKRSQTKTEALVFFEQPEDAESVVKRGKYVLDGQQLQVQYPDAELQTDGKFIGTYSSRNTLQGSTLIPSPSEEHKKIRGPETGGQRIWEPMESSSKKDIRSQSSHVPVTDLRHIQVNLSPMIVHKIVHNKCTLDRLIADLREINGKFQWVPPNDIIIKCVQQNAQDDWEANVHEILAKNIRMVQCGLSSEKGTSECKSEASSQKTSSKFTKADSQEIISHHEGTFTDVDKKNESRVTRLQARQVEIYVEKEVMQQIIEDPQKLKTLTIAVQSVKGRFKWQNPEHIVVRCLQTDPPIDWELKAKTCVNTFLEQVKADFSRVARVNIPSTVTQKCIESSCINMEVQPDLQRQSSTVLEYKIPNLTSAQIKGLSIPAAIETFYIIYPGLYIMVDKDSETAIVRCPEENIKRAFTDIMAFVWLLTEKKIPLSSVLIAMLQKTDAKEWIQNTVIEQQNLLCHWEVSGTNLVLCGQFAQLANIEQEFKCVFSEEEINLNGNESSLLDSTAWLAFEEDMKNEYRGGLPTRVLQALPQENKIMVVDIPSTIENAKEKIKKFFDSHEKELQLTYAAASSHYTTNSVIDPKNKNLDGPQRRIIDFSKTREEWYESSPVSHRFSEQGQDLSGSTERAICGYSYRQSSQFQTNPRVILIKISSQIMNKIIGEPSLLKELTTDMKAVDGKFQWKQPEHILVKRTSSSAPRDWADKVKSKVDRFILKVQRTQSVTHSEKSPSDVSWREPQSTTKMSDSDDDKSEVHMTKKVIVNLKPAQIKGLRIPQVLQKLHRAYESLEIEVNEETRIAKLKCAKGCMQKAYSDVLALIQLFREAKLPISHAMSKMFQKDDVREWVQTQVVAQYELACHWEVNETHLVLCSHTSYMTLIEQQFKDIFSEKTITLNKMETMLLKSPAGDEFQRKTEEKMDKCPAPVLLLEDKKIIIVDTPSNFRKTERKLGEFLARHSHSVNYCMTPESRNCGGALMSSQIDSGSSLSKGEWDESGSVSHRSSGQGQDFSGSTERAICGYSCMQSSQSQTNPRVILIQISSQNMNKIIGEPHLLKELTTDMKAVDGKFQWKQPDHILVKCTSTFDPEIGKTRSSLK